MSGSHRTVPAVHARRSGVVLPGLYRDVDGGERCANSLLINGLYAVEVASWLRSRF